MQKFNSAHILKSLAYTYLFFSGVTHAELNTSYYSLVDVRGINIDTSPQNWVASGLSTLRFDNGDNGIALGQAMLGAKVHLNSTLTVEGYGSAYDDAGDAFGLNELFMAYRSFPVNGYRINARAGIFFPKISLENTAQGWTSQNVLSNSAINAWIGEEIKNTGVELKIERLGKFHSSSWDTSFELTAFQNNDPAGSLLTWRGWALHDRQLRVGERTRFADLPAIRADGTFSAQSRDFDPNLEIDERVGFSGAASIKHTNHFGMQVFVYDNQGDPTVLKRGQYAWQTRFTHLAIVSPSIRGFRFKGQYLDGDTKMGDGITSMVLADYQSWYLSADYTLGKWRYTIRHDDFLVTDRDQPPMDSNNQEGNAWMFAASFRAGKNFKVIAELLRVDDTNDARKYFGLPMTWQSDQVQLAIQWRTP